jgi:arylformamidase
MFVNAGAHYVALDFIAIKEAGGDLRVMAEQVRRGIAWVYRNAGKFDGDRDRLYIGGHSSEDISAVSPSSPTGRRISTCRRTW